MNIPTSEYRYIPHITNSDLKNSDMTSDVFERKLSRAKDALTLVQSASVRTLSASLGTKWPYKRTMSAPANMVNRAVEKQGRCVFCALTDAIILSVLNLYSLYHYCTHSYSFVYHFMCHHYSYSYKVCLITNLSPIGYCIIVFYFSMIPYVRVTLLNLC